MTIQTTRDRSAIFPDGSYFDATRAAAAVRFFPKYLRHSKGEFAGRPFILDPWQQTIVEDLFGWRRANGTRLYRTAFIAVPRKNGKTTLAAGVALACLIGDGEPSAEVYSIAGNMKQASLVFAEAKNMVLQSPALAARIETLASALYVPELRSSFQPLAGKGRTQHGLNPHCVVGDEVHAWAGREQFDVMRSAMGARRQPLELYITTAGLDFETVCGELWDYAEKVAGGIIDDPSFYAAIYAAAQDDDWTDPAVWAKANPGLGVSVSRDYLAEQCERAKSLPAQEAAFRQLFLNQWGQAGAKWLPMARWDADDNAAPFNEDDLIGRPCFMGVDLAYTADLSAVAIVFPPHDGDPQWYIVVRFFVPHDGLQLRAHRDLVPYDLWARQGLMRATPGNVADYDAIGAEALAMANKFHPKEIGFDRLHGGATINMLQEAGHTCVAVGQGFYSMAAPTATFERAVLAGHMRHGSHAVLSWNASNVIVRRDEQGNMKPDHRASRERIDGISATLTAMALALAPPKPDATPYEGRDLLILG